MVILLCTEGLEGGGARSVSSCFHSNSFVSSTAAGNHRVCCRSMCSLPSMDILNHMFALHIEVAVHF